MLVSALRYALVAPFTGAWIEIQLAMTYAAIAPTSHPSRVRGLKFQWRSKRKTADHVAPFTGAWIEIQSSVHMTIPTTSSHPSRVRGLKYPQRRIKIYSNCVAPFTGAWIEIRHASRGKKIARVAPFTGAWIEIAVAVPCATSP